MRFRSFIFCTTNIMTVSLIVKPLFIKNENFSRYIVIAYNEFQPTIEVENSGLSYWDHNGGELLQKIVFFLPNVALLSANRAFIANKNLTMVHIFFRVFCCFQILWILLR